MRSKCARVCPLHKRAARVRTRPARGEASTHPRRVRRPAHAAIHALNGGTLARDHASVATAARERLRRNGGARTASSQRRRAATSVSQRRRANGFVATAARAPRAARRHLARRGHLALAAREQTAARAPRASRRRGHRTRFVLQQHASTRRPSSQLAGTSGARRGRPTAGSFLAAISGTGTGTGTLTGAAVASEYGVLAGHHRVRY